MSDTARPSSGGWCRVANAAAERIAEVGTTALAVYVALARHADQDGRCWPSVARLGRMVGSHKNTVLRALRVLESAGWITVDRASGAANRYHLPPLGTGTVDETGTVYGTGTASEATPVPLARPGGTVDETGTGTADETQRRPTRKRPNKKTQRTTAIPPSLGVEPFVDAWGDWLAYRRERKLTCTARTLRAQLDKLEAFGPEAAAREIRESIGHGWHSVCYRPHRTSQPTPGRIHAEPGQYDDLEVAICGGK